MYRRDKGVAGWKGGGEGRCIEEMKRWLDRRGGGGVGRCKAEMKGWLDGRGRSG